MECVPICLMWSFFVPHVFLMCSLYRSGWVPLTWRPTETRDNVVMIGSMAGLMMAGMYLCTYRYVRTDMYVPICSPIYEPICTYRYVCTDMYVPMFVPICLYRYVPICMFQYVCTDMYVPICMYRYVCTDMFTDI